MDILHIIKHNEKITVYHRHHIKSYILSIMRIVSLARKFMDDMDYRIGNHKLHSIPQNSNKGTRDYIRRPRKYRILE